MREPLRAPRIRALSDSRFDLLPSEEAQKIACGDEGESSSSSRAALPQGDPGSPRFGGALVIRRWDANGYETGTTTDCARDAGARGECLGCGVRGRPDVGRITPKNSEMTRIVVLSFPLFPQLTMSLPQRALAPLAARGRGERPADDPAARPATHARHARARGGRAPEGRAGAARPLQVSFTLDVYSHAVPAP